MDQINKHKVMMTLERSAGIVNFMTSETAGLVLVRGHISHIVKKHYFF